jgi:hypothetical protein
MLSDEIHLEHARLKTCTFSTKASSRVWPLTTDERPGIVVAVVSIKGLAAGTGVSLEMFLGRGPMNL